MDFKERNQSHFSFDTWKRVGLDLTNLMKYGEIMRAGLEAPCPENDADINRDLLAEQVIDTLAPQLERIEAAAKEATQTAQETQTELEGLQ